MDMLNDSSRSWDMVMMHILFKSVGGLFNFSYAGYVFRYRGVFQGATLRSTRMGVPIASAPVTLSGQRGLKTHDEANVMESCGIVGQQIEKILPAYVIRGARRKVALIHEMIPLPNQGGNIRLIQILDILLVNGFQIEIFVRENIDADTVISINDKHSVRLGR